ncbi:uncharacterized protein YneF (UPF0154 family) [Nakamurella sp. UYEF19]|uniref:hypothetical protein n=1 Tax=Nakamurella sp. UYEF19 TaxID=1756392 RepID=UPI0033953968
MTSRQRDGRRPSAPKHDRAIAMGIWVITGLLFGFAVGVFTGHGWLWLAVGLLLGVVLAIWRTKPEQTIEED